MNTPAPKSSLSPSGSTIGSLVGGAAAVLIIAGVEYLLKVQVSGAVAAAITTLCSVAAGYLPASGRSTGVPS